MTSIGGVQRLSLVNFLLFLSGSTEVDQIIKVLLSTNMFVAGFFGCIFDNTVPGTLEERGMIKWRRHEVDDSTTVNSSNSESEVYNLPWFLSSLSRSQFSKFIPFLPYYPSAPQVMHGNIAESTTAF